MMLIESHAESKPDTEDEDMENGYDTQVSEMGASLSSGPSSVRFSAFIFAIVTFYKTVI